MSKHTPTPWEAREVQGAGIEIHAPVHLVDTIEWPRAAPTTPVMIFQLTEPAGHKLIACERWVQFEPDGWHAMQWANARLIAAAPELLETLESVIAESAIVQTNSKYDTIQISHGVLDDIRELIAKAKGQP